jgi:hypothetical protein
MIVLGVTLVVAAVLGLHAALARLGPVWPGGLVPGVLAVVVTVLLVQGRIPPGRPYLVIAAALVMLVWMWASARQGRAGTVPAREAVAEHPTA